MRQQLIIGGSSLDKVLSAEARLYEAQSKEIDFEAEKKIAEAAVSGFGSLNEIIRIVSLRCRLITQALNVKYSVIVVNRLSTFAQECCEVRI